MSDTNGQLRAFIVENYLFGEAGNLKDSDSFLDLGIIDSTGVLELVSHLEQEYGFGIDTEEIVPENLDSVERLTAFVRRKQALNTASATRQVKGTEYGVESQR